MSNCRQSNHPLGTILSIGLMGCFFSTTSFWGYAVPLVFYLMCCIVLPLSWVTLVSKPIRIPITLTELLLFLFVVYIFLHSSYFKPGQFIQGYKIQVLLLFLIVYFPFKRTIIEQEYLLQKFIILYLIAGLAVDIYSYLQFIQILPSGHPQFSITGNFHNPGILAIYQCLIIATATCVHLIYKNDKTLRVLSSIVLILTLPFYIYCFSRASFFGLFAAICIVIFCKKGNYLKPILRKPLIWVLFLLLITILGYGLFYLRPNSAMGRAFIWNRSIEWVFKHGQISGTGINSFQKEYPYIQAKYFKDHPESRYKYISDETGTPFNEFILVLFEVGLIGFFLFVFIHLLLVKYVIRILGRFKGKTYRSIPNVIGCTWFMILLSASLFSYPSFFPFLLFHFLISVALITYNDSDILFQLKVEKPSFRRLLVIGISLLCFIVCFLNVSRQMRKEELHEFYKQQTIYGNLWYLKKLQEYKPYFKNGPYFLLKLAKAQYEEGKISESFKTYETIKYLRPDYHLFIKLGDLYKDNKMYKRAEENYLLASNLIPSRFVPKQRLIQLYQETKDTIKIIQVSGEIVNQKAKSPSEYIARLKEYSSDILKNIKK